MNSNPATKNTGRRTVTLRLEDAVAKKLRILATVNGQTVNHILRELVEAHLLAHQHQLSGFPLWPKIDDV